MKSFMKLLVTIIVVALIGFVVSYLLMNGAKPSTSIEPGENIKSGEEELIVKSGEESVEIVEDFSGEEETNPETTESGDNVSDIPKEEKIRLINEKVRMIDSNEEEVETFDDKLTLDLANDSAKEAMKYFKSDTLSVSVNKKTGKIEIIPYSDFVENMVYYFDENGNLIMYESVSTTVGGSCKYYFDNGKGISVVVAYDEDVDAKEEYVGDVLNRALLVYDKYFNN